MLPCALLLSCASTAGVQAPAADTVPAASAPDDGDPAGLSALLPPPPGGAQPPGDLSAALSSVSQLLAREPAYDTAPVGDDLADPRARQKIEAYFDGRQRFEDDYRVRATELIAVLMSTVGDDPGEDLLRHALSAILLEDQSALGFGVPGDVGGATDASAEHLGEQLARPRVPYAALSARVYQRCGQLAAEQGWAPWQRLCEEGARRMRLRAAALPACSDDSLIAAGHGAPPSAPGADGHGLLLNGAYDVPLLEVELQRVLARAHATLQRQLGGVLEAPELGPTAAVSPPAEATAPACAHTPRPSEQLFMTLPDTEWLGLTLHCQGSQCGLSACSNGQAGCFSAPLRGEPWDVAAWVDAAGRLTRSDGGPLLEAPAATDDTIDVSLQSVRFHGAWKHAQDAQRALAAQLPRLSACQTQQRYHDEWLLDVDRSGRVRALRASSPAHPYPMDEAVVGSAPARRCVRDALQGLQLPKGRGRGARRLSLALHIPASLQIELPLTMRHSRRMGPHDAGERLARDGFAVGIARCMAGAQLAPRAIGLCARVNAGGRVERLHLDLSPLRSARARATLAARPSGDQPVQPPTGVHQCLAQVLEGLDWSCQRDGHVGHVAATLQLPSELLQRF